MVAREQILWKCSCCTEIRRCLLWVSALTLWWWNLGHMDHCGRGKYNTVFSRSKARRIHSWHQLIAVCHWIEIAWQTAPCTGMKIGPIKSSCIHSEIRFVLLLETSGCSRKWWAGSSFSLSRCEAHVWMWKTWAQILCLPQSDWWSELYLTLYFDSLRLHTVSKVCVCTCTCVCRVRMNTCQPH